MSHGSTFDSAYNSEEVLELAQNLMQDHHVAGGESLLLSIADTLIEHEIFEITKAMGTYLFWAYSYGTSAIDHLTPAQQAAIKKLNQDHDDLMYKLANQVKRGY